jgi:hypothetical protein
MKVKGNEVLWQSENGNVVVAYSVFDFGNKYKIYRKICYEPDNIICWEFTNCFATMGEAVSYARKIFDTLVTR